MSTHGGARPGAGRKRVIQGKRTWIGFRAPEDLRLELQRQAYKNGWTLTEEIRDRLRKSLEGP